jgi:sigma-B regulation protein RsbU (phosphoserine phosphatase)
MQQKMMFMSKFFYSIRFRIHALNVGLVFAISVAFLVIFLENSRRTNSKHLEDIAKKTVQYLNADIQNALAPAIDMANYVATFADDYDLEQNTHILGKMLPAVSSAFEAYYGTTLSRFDGGWFATATDWDPYSTNPNWDQLKRPWFIYAMQSPGKITITDPYEDSNTGEICVTIVKTVADSTGKIKGVVGVDIFLDKLTEIINEHKITEDGKSFLVDANGLYITHQDTSKILENNILEDMKLDKSILKKQGIKFRDGMYITFIAVPNTPNWHFVSIGSLKSLDKMDLTPILIIIAIFIVLSIIVSFVLGSRISKPIKKLTDDVSKLGLSDLDIRVEVNTNDELGILARTFNKMTADLEVSIETSTRERAEKERIGAELNVAKDIQVSMLPCLFPAFPHRTEFDIYASMQPAKEVGGDFYDFFLIDDNTLAAVIADVSGKGVPAALFMVIAKTLIKNNAQSGKSPKEVFEIVNNLLCENNEASMFVSAILGYLDIPTGKFTFVNAGHNPPLLRTNGRFNWLKTEPDLVLAVMENISYKQHEITLNRGDELFMYTDGVTEAVNNKGDLFNNQRLLEVANNYLDLSLREFIVSIKCEVDKFADGAEQADDITMLALKMKYHK